MQVFTLHRYNVMVLHRVALGAQLCNDVINSSKRWQIIPRCCKWEIMLKVATYMARGNIAEPMPWLISSPNEVAPLEKAMVSLGYAFGNKLHVQDGDLSNVTTLSMQQLQHKFGFLRSCSSRPSESCSLPSRPTRNVIVRARDEQQTLIFFLKLIAVSFCRLCHVTAANARRRWKISIN